VDGAAVQRTAWRPGAAWQFQHGLTIRQPAAAPLRWKAQVPDSRVPRRSGLRALRDVGDAEPGARLLEAAGNG